MKMLNLSSHMLMVIMPLCGAMNIQDLLGSNFLEKPRPVMCTQF